MNPFDLRKAIVEGNRSDKLYRKAMKIVADTIAGKDTRVFCPDEKTTKMFFDKVIEKLEGR